VDQLRLSAADVARKLSLTPSAVSKLLVRGRQGGLAKTMAKEIYSLKWPEKGVEKSVQAFDGQMSTFRQRPVKPA
jgi:predicted transcriptional regulator